VNKRKIKPSEENTLSLVPLRYFQRFGQNSCEVIEMKCNVGRTEQIVRIMIGVLIVLLGLYFRNWWGVIGLAPIITGAIRYCPVSDVLGISTCDAKE